MMNYILMYCGYCCIAALIAFVVPKCTGLLSRVSDSAELLVVLENAFEAGEKWHTKPFAKHREELASRTWDGLKLCAEKGPKQIELWFKNQLAKKNKAKKAAAANAPP